MKLRVPCSLHIACVGTYNICLLKTHLGPNFGICFGKIGIRFARASADDYRQHTLGSFPSRDMLFKAAAAILVPLLGLHIYIDWYRPFYAPPKLEKVSPSAFE